MKSHSDAQDELQGLSKVLVPQPPKCPGCFSARTLPRQSCHIITCPVLLREQLKGEERTYLRVTACGWKELMEKINHPSDLG